MRITVRDVRSGFEVRSGGARQLVQIHGREQRMLYGLKSVEKLLANGGKPLLMLSGCGWNCSGSGQRPVGLMRELALLGYAAIYHSTLERETRLVDNVLVIDRVGLDAAMPVLLKAWVCNINPAYLDAARQEFYLCGVAVRLRPGRRLG